MIDLPSKGTRVVVAMSGGVDSSVAAALLVEAGMDVVGIALQTTDYSKYLNDDSGGSCCSAKDMEDARRVAESIGIPFYVLGTEDNFDANVVDYFVEDYLNGRTPNPCVMCNTRVKFNHLYKKAMNLGAEFVATGHFAQVKKDPDLGFHLKMGTDSNKDQSYFLFNLNQAQLARTLFPVGHLTKAQVREEAAKRGLLTAAKKESQEICFVPDNNYKKFISERVSKDKIKKGFISTTDGVLLTSHDGIHNFTIGQRKGLSKAFEAAQKKKLDVSNLFVVSIDSLNGTVYLGDKSELLSADVHLKDINWIGEDMPKESKKIQVKVRYRTQPVEASFDPKEMKLKLAAPQRAISPGQAAVFFEGDRCLGGAWICRESEK